MGWSHVGGFGLQVDVVVARPLVHDLDMRLLVLHNLVLDRAVVAVLRVVFDFAVDLRVLREDLSQQKLLRKGKRFHLCRGHVHELSLDVVAEVVVAKEAVRSKLVRRAILASVQRLLVQVIAHADSSRNDKVHF